MKKINLTLATLAVIALASCTNDEIADTSPVNNPEQETPIVFSSLKKGMTRNDFIGADAASLLGKQFVVSGYKGSQTTWNDADNVMVFDNYAVKYEENTANTTESNVANWEYVGVDRIKHAIDNGITRQAIKYWDYSAPQYDFIAWSTGLKTAIYKDKTEYPTLGANEVRVSAITPKTATGTGDGKVAYTFEGTAENLRQCYISDLVTITKSNTNYKNPVTLKFRQLGTKVRIGIYETIPGYSVKDVKFYTKGTVLDKDGTDPTKPAAGQIIDNATIFSAGADIYTEGTYTVTFPSVDGTTADNNQAHVKFAPKTGVDQTTVVDFGTMNYTYAEDGQKTTGRKFLGRSSNTASFAGNPDDNYYVIYLPNENGANLNLRVDFTLESIDGGGENIVVKNAKAQVPSIYTTWKPGFAYTYLFKISDKTNGRTGVYDPTESDDATVNSDPAGLYPITFDAVVVNAEDNDQTQETITTVMTPSITTYQKESTVVNADEYTDNGNDIFVTVNEGDNLVTLTSKAALYTIPVGKTEADVIDALQMQDDDNATGTIKGRSGLVMTAATQVSSASDIDAANKYALTNSVEFGADGNAISVSANQALRFKPNAKTTYAFVYTKTAANPSNNKIKYEPVAFTDATVATKYRYDYKKAEWSYHYSTEFLSYSYYDAQKGRNYFARTGAGTTESPYVYTLQTPFIGQDVSNLYTKSGATYIKATGYAARQNTYYYTLDQGKTYIEAQKILYDHFASATLYLNPNGTVAKTETTPVDGQAYYKQTGGSGTPEDPYVYTYCVIYPQQTDDWYELDTDKYVVADEAAAVTGQTYFDKYTQNDGVYYTKIIKVQ